MHSVTEPEARGLYRSSCLELSEDESEADALVPELLLRPYHTVLGCARRQRQNGGWMQSLASPQLQL